MLFKLNFTFAHLNLAKSVYKQKGFFQKRDDPLDVCQGIFLQLIGLS